MNDWPDARHTLLRFCCESRACETGSAHITHVVAAMQFSNLTITPATSTFDSSFVELRASVHMAPLIHYMSNEHTTHNNSSVMLAYA